MSKHYSIVDSGSNQAYPGSAVQTSATIPKDPLAQAGGFFGAASPTAKERSTRSDAHQGGTAERRSNGDPVIRIKNDARPKTEKELARERIARNEQRQAENGHADPEWERLPGKKVFRRRKERGIKYRRSNGSTVHGNVSMKTVLNQENAYFQRLKKIKEKKEGKPLKVRYMSRRVKPSLYLPDNLRKAYGWS